MTSKLLPPTLTGPVDIAASELDHLVFYEKPLRKFERVLLHQLKGYPRTSRSFVRSAFAWLGDRLWIKNRLVKNFGYSEVSATDVLNYVASIFARGDVKKV